MIAPGKVRRLAVMTYLMSWRKYPIAPITTASRWAAFITLWLVGWVTIASTTHEGAL